MIQSEQSELTCLTVDCSLHPDSDASGPFTLCEHCIEKYLNPE
jgi:hypothetical protein